MIALLLISLLNFVPAPHLNSVYWNRTEALEGQPVRLNLEGVSLDGHEISFQVLERDTGGIDDSIITNPSNIIYDSSEPYTTWIAEWQDDTDEGQTNPPEYYFIAQVIGYGSMTSSTADADMLKVYNCGDGICNGAETCSTCSADCGICPSNCELTSATWSVTEALEGQPARLNLEGTDCNGKTINFEVKEEDGLFNPDDPVITNPSPILFDSPNTYGVWTVEWQDDNDGGQTNPPEYYFLASVQGESESITSSKAADDMLKVESIMECIGRNYCFDYTTEASCESDFCNLGYNSAPEAISCGLLFDSVSGCNVSTNCGCSWNNALNICESEWNSELICAANTSIGECDYTENSQDTCEDDGMLVRSLTALWTWDVTNPTHLDPLGQEQKCINIQEMIPCPASTQVKFFVVYQLVIVITIIGFIYFLNLSKKNNKKSQ